MPSSSHSRAMNQKQKKKKQKHRKVREGNNSFFLPEEITNNILIRLPVKSLIRFQSVCKNWKNLIKTQSFIVEHLHHYSNQNPCLLFCNYYALDSKQLYLLNNQMKVVELHCESVCYSEIIDSINGLLCVTLSDSSHPFALWNPATRQVKLVAKTGKCYRGWGIVFGFGFNSIGNDYNILAMDVNMPDVHGEVYSLKTGSWKKAECSPLRNVHLSRNCFAPNGSIFWVGMKYNVDMDRKDHVLVSYDMAMEVFTLMQSPISPIEEVDSHSIRLTIHENKLAILSCTSIGDPVSSLIDMWVMEVGIGGESGERCGWTKKFSTSHSSLSIAMTTWKNKMVCLTCLPWSIRAIGRVMLGDERKRFGLVDLTTSEVNMFENGICDRPYLFFNHVESLVPVGNNHIEEL